MISNDCSFILVDSALPNSLKFFVVLHEIGHLKLGYVKK